MALRMTVSEFLRRKGLVANHSRLSEKQRVKAAVRKRAPKRVSKSFDQFFNAYLEAALWSSTDEDGESLDIYNDADIDPKTLAEMRSEAQEFYDANAEMFNGKDDQAGHDFWLTRNGHGAGYWDRSDLYGEGNGDKLTQASKVYGSYDLYVGDDGKIYRQ